MAWSGGPVRGSDTQDLVMAGVELYGEVWIAWLTPGAEDTLICLTDAVAMQRGDRC